MRSNTSEGLNPSGPTSLVSLSICCLIPEPRWRCFALRFGRWPALPASLNISNHLRICNAPVLARGDQSLVPDVFGCGGINGVLGDVRGVIAHPFEATANKYQIQVTSQLLRVLRHALD